MKGQKYLMSGKYHYSRDASSEIIEKDTLITDIVYFEDHSAVKLQGNNHGYISVFDSKKILDKPRTRKIVFRKKPCNCQNFGFGKTEWMAGVPIYCKSINNGGSCPLIKQTGDNLFKCDYKNGLLSNYIKVSTICNIEIERITKTL